MSSIADRIKILRKGAWPDYNLAIQFILNCGTNVAGSCDGGSAEGAFQFAQSGIPEATCLQYDANDDACLPINTCRNCVSQAHTRAFPISLSTRPPLIQSQLLMLPLSRTL
jgi:cathepsin X